MDSNEPEASAASMIMAKNTAVHYKDHPINIVDTPGHADFGGKSSGRFDGGRRCCSSTRPRGPSETRFYCGKRWNAA